MQESAGEQLTAPLSFFVEVSTFTSMTQKPPADHELKYKRFQGTTLTGVTQQRGNGIGGKCSGMSL